MKTKFGSIIVAGSGKIGGHVASKNKSGSYLRTKVTPSNPQTAAQLSVRGDFTTVSKAWESLTDSQRSGWSSAVSSFKKTNIFGDSVTPSGFNLFVKLNQNLLNIGEDMIEDAPQATSPTAIASLSATAVSSTGVVTLTFADAIPVTDKVVVMATAPQAAGVSYVKNLYRKVTVLASTDVSPKAITAAYAAKFGAPSNAGQRIFFKLFPVLIESGVSGAAIPAETIIS
jgi:hypothetical protein